MLIKVVSYLQLNHNKDLVEKIFKRSDEVIYQFTNCSFLVVVGENKMATLDNYRVSCQKVLETKLTFYRNINKRFSVSRCVCVCVTRQ